MPQKTQYPRKQITQTSEPCGFGLRRDPGGVGLWSRPLSEVRSLALNKAPSAATEKTRRIVARQRSEAVRIYVLRRAHGTCEACNRGAPFQASAGRPYLEPHHIHRLADGGPDAPNAVAAVCPNFHREVHHGVNGKSLNDKLAQVVETLEADS